MEQKPSWMLLHEQSDQKNFDEIRETLNRIEETLKPMAENYATATSLGKWVMGFAVFGSVILGIILSLKALLGK